MPAINHDKAQADHLLAILAESLFQLADKTPLVTEYHPFTDIISNHIHCSYAAICDVSKRIEGGNTQVPTRMLYSAQL